MSGGHSLLKGFQERFTKYIGVVASDHAYIHKGIGYGLHFFIDDLAAAGTSNIGFTTPASTVGYIHYRPEKIATSANIVRAVLYEGVSYSAGSQSIPFNLNRNSSNLSSVIAYGGVTATLTGTVVVSAKAGGNFANQPAGDGLEILSDDAADTTQTVTVYGTITGATTTVTSETVTLTGTDAVSTTEVTWQNILGIEVSAAHAGTITVREASGDATIITLATGTNSAGVETPTSTVGNNKIPRHDASGASTAPVGIIGTNYAGTSITSVDALNGTTEEDHGGLAFLTITKVLIGAVASTVNVSILAPSKTLTVTQSGSGGGVQSRSGGEAGETNELVLIPETPYVLSVSNIGASTATDIDVNMFFYEEENG